MNITPKFKIGDIVSYTEEIKNSFTSMKITSIDKSNYYLKIPTGKIILPIKAQDILKLI